MSDIKNPTYPNIKSLIGLFIALLVNMIFSTLVISGIIAAYVAISKVQPSDLLKSALSLFAYTMMMLFTIQFAIRRSKGSVSDYSFNRVSVGLVPLIIISALALYLCLEPIATSIPMPEEVKNFFKNMFRPDFFSVLLMVVAAPLLEEILCRGIVLKGLLENYSPMKAILISAFFFGLIHMNPWQAVPAFLFGLFVGWVFYKTRSIIPGIIMHATVNGVSASAMFLPEDKQELQQLLSTTNYVLLCLAALVVFIACCMYLQKTLTVKR